MTSFSTNPCRRSAVAVVSVLMVAACGSGSSGSGSASSPVSKAEAKVKSAKSAVASATTSFESASKSFCSDSKDLIATLDRYGKVIDSDAVTVGQVKSGPRDLRASRASAGSSAEAAVEAHEDLVKAEQELAKAEAELEAARAHASGASSPTTAVTTTTLPPVPSATVARVERAEKELVAASENVADTTPVREAGVKLHSAAFAVEVAWMQLVVQAGCLSDEQRVRAIEQVTDATRALQADLTAAGYYHGPVDGLYGPSTVASVEELQQDTGLPVTGLPDGPTQRALDTKLQQQAGHAAAGASTRNAAIQGALKALGYWDGPVDGEWSDALGDAIKKLQTDLGVPVTGAVDTVTLQALEEKLAATKALVDGSSTSTTSSTSTPAPGS